MKILKGFQQIFWQNVIFRQKKPLSEIKLTRLKYQRFKTTLKNHSNPLKIGKVCYHNWIRVFEDLVFMIHNPNPKSGFVVTAQVESKDLENKSTFSQISNPHLATLKVSLKNT